MGVSIPHIITDVVLLGVPMPLIWNLRLNLARKFMLTTVFAVGILYAALFFWLPSQLHYRRWLFLLTNVLNLA